jgi:hypothetical protein
MQPARSLALPLEQVRGQLFGRSGAMCKGKWWGLAVGGRLAPRKLGRCGKRRRGVGELVPAAGELALVGCLRLPITTAPGLFCNLWRSWPFTPC